MDSSIFLFPKGCDFYTLLMLHCYYVTMKNFLNKDVPIQRLVLSSDNSVHLIHVKTLFCSTELGVGFIITLGEGKTLQLIWRL